MSNITEIVDVHENLLKSLIECSAIVPDQQRIGRIFLSTAVKLKQVHEKYCTSHPRAVLILEKHKYVLRIAKKKFFPVKFDLFVRCN